MQVFRLGTTYQLLNQPLGIGKDKNCKVIPNHPSQTRKGVKKIIPDRT